MSEQKLNLVTTFGSGLLLGAAFIIILPEGVETVYDSQQQMWNAHQVNQAVAKQTAEEKPHESSVNRDIGVSLLSGFACMLLVDQFSSYFQRKNHQPIPISISDFSRDREVLSTSTPTWASSIDFLD
jgi:zinc transporter 9